MAKRPDRPAPPVARLTDKPGAWVDLGLTLPIFLLYHVGVIFLRVRNGSDLVTGAILELSEGDLRKYLAITALIGIIFATFFSVLGRGQAFAPRKFLQITLEGIVYAVLMRLGAEYVVGRMFAGRGDVIGDPFVGIVMSLGAGFYEELTFRVIVFGLGAKLLVSTLANERLRLTARSGPLSFGAGVILLVWSLVAAAIFSGAHYLGAMGDTFSMVSFVFRFLLGMALTLIYVTRGFAATVWTHAVYDVWVIVF